MKIRRKVFWKCLIVLQSFVCLLESHAETDIQEETADSEQEIDGFTQRLNFLCRDVIDSMILRKADNHHSGFEPAQISFCLEMMLEGIYSTNCEFNVSVCNVPCPLVGYHQNPKNGCIDSCDCKTSGLFEGDIRFDERDLNVMRHIYLNTTVPDGNSTIRIWDEYVASDTIKIPFNIDESDFVSQNPKTDVLIRDAVSLIEDKTCLQFIQRTDEEDFLEFHQGTGCWSYIGRQGGRQSIFIGTGCETQRTILHEIMHALGFWHEHTRSDRDEHVEIVYENIDNGKEKHFLKRTQAESSDSTYDYESVMQFGGFVYSKNKGPTLLDKRTNEPMKIETNTLSNGDIARIIKRYGCDKRKNSDTRSDKSEL